MIDSLRRTAIKCANQLLTLDNMLHCELGKESGGLALASPPFERCPEGNKLNALSLEQEASLATFLKVSASSWRFPEDATKANMQRF